MGETWVCSLGREDTLEKEMAPHSSTLAWKIPWTEEPGRLQSMGLQRVGYDWATSLSNSYLTRTPVFKCVPSLVWLFVTPWTVILQAPPAMGFSRQGYWSGLPFPPAGDLFYPGIELASPVSLILAGGFFTTEPPRKPKTFLECSYFTFMLLL